MLKSQRMTLKAQQIHSKPRPTSKATMNTVNKPFALQKLPARYASIVMPFFLSILMTCIVSFVSTLRSTGWTAQFINLWMGSWGISWLVAFPVLLLVLPLVKKLTAAVVQTPQ